MNHLSFGFSGIEDDKELQKEVNLRVVQILAQAPPGAFSSGRVELLGLTHFSHVKIESPFKTFLAQAAGMSARSALMRALDRLEDQINRWRWGLSPVVQPEELPTPHEKLEYY
jgi:hypothetical protein